ncbi:O-antigen translocase [Vibrio fluvialis]|uniref:O-antigen translocase n=1 Tax=Vibrio fluvialis TaxID=676 RepID=UPI0028DFA742|nr:O-antigen translocase [Vibrio fluvialis]MDT8869692.1 O-antigen translocase [Vibrio fluvialis]MDT8877462.1 O-antigen translocase [Vibrio fluvialis]
MKKLLQVSVMSGLLTLLRMSMGFIISKVVAVYTGPSGLAMLGQVQSLVVSLNGVVNAPVGSGLVRFTAEHHRKGFEQCSPWWRASIYWVSMLLALVIPIGVLFSQNIAYWLMKDTSLAWVVVVTVLVLPLSTFGSLCNSVINGQELYRRYVLIGMLSTVISSAFMLLLIITSNISGALLAASIQSALLGIIMLITNMKQPWFKLKYWWGEIEDKARKDIKGYMYMALTTAITVPVSLIVVRNILVSQLGWDSAGLWQAVWKISELYLGVVTIALGTYYLPRLSSLVDIKEIKREINSTAMVVIPIVIIMAIAIYFLKDFIIFILFTPEFEKSKDLFLFQLGGDVLKIASFIYAYPMISRGATKIYVISELLFSILFIVFSYFLINIFELKGASIAYLINYFLYFSFSLCYVKSLSNNDASSS